MHGKLQKLVIVFLSSISILLNFSLPKMVSANTVNNYNCLLANDYVNTIKIDSEPTSINSEAFIPSPSEKVKKISFLGHSYKVGLFEGSGEVPNDGKIYSWVNLPNWYLVEKTSKPGKKITRLKIGDAVKIKKHVYHVFHIDRHQSNSIDNFYYIEDMLERNSAIGLQTCEKAQTNSLLTFYFAK